MRPHAPARGRRARPAPTPRHLPYPSHEQVTGGDPDLAEDKRRSLPFRDAEALAFSFRRLARISGLAGLGALTKLQLDNNRITRVENLSHLVGAAGAARAAAAAAAARAARGPRGGSHRALVGGFCNPRPHDPTAPRPP
jgi:hypothetical protein